MEAILLYFGKIILCSGVMFLYYQLSLKDKTFHHYNRFYLLSAILIPLLLPLIKVEDFTIEVSHEMYLLLDKVQNFNTEKNINNGNLYFNIIFSALGLVSFYFLGKLAIGIFRIQQFKKKFQKESFDGINFYRTDLTEAPFSYFKNLFWKNTITLNSEIGKQILKHEMVHIEQKHSFDKILIEIVTSIFWFNPFFHLIKKEINLIHEYLADKKAVKHSDTKAFAQMLLASHFSGTQLPAASPFLSSNLKKRLKMLQKPKTKFGYARRIFALPVLFSVAFAYLVNAKNREIEETNLTIKKAVSQIQRDTVRPEKTQQPEKTELSNFNNDESNKKLAELQKKINKKQKELGKLDPGSKAFEKKMDEINDLVSSMTEITDETTQKMNEYFNSPAWKRQMSELENMEIEIPEIPEAPEAPELNTESPKAPSAAPKVPKAPKNAIYIRNNRVEYKDLSPEDKAEVRKALKEAQKAIREGAKARMEGEKARIQGEVARAIGAKARIEGETARIIGDKARLEGERMRKEGERIRIDGDRIRKQADIARAEAEKRALSFKDGTFIKITNASPDVIVMNADFIKKDGNGNIVMNGVKKFRVSGNDDVNYKYYIDGKEASKNDVNSLDTKDISRVNVNTQKKGDVKQGEVRIETKK
ncbi:M56 family metallopeptidase [Chryseobacterium sp. Mn2064]|uniref:M56 family metallopeptidase n=1 Tax=Chryseobacterium sp. Mn2064 TaxID=3395263 RepID=UPI003BC5F068